MTGFRGSVIARGFAVDRALVGDGEAQRRILALWARGAELRVHGTLLVVSGLPAQRVRIAQAPGAPLVEQGGVLATLPVAPGRYAAGAIVVAIDGAAVEVRGAPFALADWISLSLEVAEVASLAAPPARAAVPPRPAELRALVGVRDEDPMMREVAAALRGAAGGGASWWARLLGGAGASLWQRLWRRKAAGAASSTALAPRTRSLVDRLRARLALALWRSALGRVLGRRYAAYLHDLLARFDRGDLDEALRRAIPLGGDGGPATLALGLPSPRDKLAVQLGPRGGGSVIPGSDAAVDVLREKYRAAARRLEDQGRIDEATFVLADLLGDVPGALALLERHQRYALAAQLAEARAQPAEHIVRLWFLARNIQRVIDVTRRHQAWAAALMLLQRDRAHADALRLLWANQLASAGEVLAAVEVAERVAAAHHLVGAWIARGLAAGGTVAARMVVKAIARAPDQLAAQLPAVHALLADRDDDASHARAALTEQLLATAATPALRVLARPVVRTLLRDCAAGDPRALVDRIARLIDYTGDAALRADEPTVKPVRREGEQALGWLAGDAGALPVLDAARLPGGRTAVALGELGVCILDAAGRAIARIDQPAHRLVISDAGTRALALAPRGEVQRVARLDLIERRGAYWCDAACDGGAGSFDGDVWLATHGADVLAIDTTGSRWRAIWGVNVDGAVAPPRIRREPGAFAIEVPQDGGREYWFYSGFTLQRRRPAATVDTDCVALAWIADHGAMIAAPRVLRADDVRIPLCDLPVHAVETATPYAAVAQRADDAVVVTCARPRTASTLVTLTLAGAGRVRMRWQGVMLVLADDRGRVIAYDADIGRVVRDLRVVGV